MICLIVLMLLLFVINLFVGSVDIPVAEVVALFMGQSSAEEVALIVLHSRLPEAVVALLSGGGLAVAGLVMQTLFSNPLADSSLLGVNAGASLGVAVAMLVCGGSFSIGEVLLMGRWFVLVAAFVGAMLVMLLLMMSAQVMRGTLQLLITGVMISFAISAVIAILSFFASAQGVQTYVVWGLGTFSGIPLANLPLLSASVVLGVGGIYMLSKHLNALMLGDAYAQNLGVRIVFVRTSLLFWVGIVVAAVTAFCGPIGFIGLAVPYGVRLLFRTGNHRKLIPACFLGGSCLALCCNVLARSVSDYSVLPINTLTPLFGVPVVLMLLRSGREYS